MIYFARFYFRKNLVQLEISNENEIISYFFITLITQRFTEYFTEFHRELWKYRFYYTVNRQSLIEKKEKPL